MDDISIFQEKAMIPTEKDLMEKLGGIYDLWVRIGDFVMKKYPDGLAEWNYPGKKYGWSYRIKDKKRAILYFLPRDKYFKVAFVFGPKATEQVMESNISQEIKSALEQATKYAEGRGVRIDIKDDSKLPDIQELVQIKLAN